MNKFLIVFLAVVFMVTSAFRVKTKQSDEHDLEDLLEHCMACADHHDDSRLQQDDHCEDIREACEELADHLDADHDHDHDDHDDDDDEDEDDHHHGHHGGQ